MRSFLKSFVYAGRGISALFNRERNFRVQLTGLILVIAAGFFFSITKIEWLIIAASSSLVLAMEAMNTAIEKLCDLYSKEENDQIRVIKDIAAGAVLICAAGAAIVGAVIFYPYFIH